jgi:uncharacterized membrane protein
MQKLTQGALVMASYVALTLLLGPISYGPIQVRLAAGLYILAGFRRDFVVPLTLATAMSNYFGGFGIPDIIFGSIVTCITCLACSLVGPKKINALIIPLVSAPLLASYLHLMFKMPFILTLLYLFVGQAVASCSLGLTLYNTVRRHKLC